jgi:hypothetical protein
MIKMPLSTVRHGNLVPMMVRQNRSGGPSEEVFNNICAKRMLTGHQD